MVTNGSLRWYHLDFYFVSFLAPFTIANMVIAVRRIFQHETMRGKELKTRKQSVFAGNQTSEWVAIRTKRWRRFLRVLVRILPTGFQLSLAGAYVHAATRFNLCTDQAIVWFGVGSFALKLLVQELVKIVILKRHVNDMRNIFVFVGLPTVLIDTQIRLAMQRYQNASMSLQSTFAMAFVEIVLRWIKVLKLAFEMRFHECIMPSCAQSPQTNSVSPTVLLGDTTRLPTQQTLEFHQWRKRLLLFHAAEAFADMSGEYIAIGSSALVLHVFGHQPKYELTLSTKCVDTRSTSLGIQVNSTAIVWIQLVLEVLVDLISCAIEISQGVDFQDLRRHRAYIAFTFLAIGLLNVQVSTLMYLKS
ncbi:hypothetical protein Poli38472_012788 [Pythium oligandrum]|uniref:Uncharacterized protein n=1 Tax=Pythium oligandrum TaxID=41045 RepID=A0A8K1CE33_PYTOL|nr:hypothetical protein Poli38472_012788 [Pythium oligandrum]|eukprot:TMW61597.1 hypothetical protein Poli38472_012788 [Pythium oligandrum]